ncbi:MAG: AMP-binding protein [Desulfobacterales bacterium]|nr:AMP-binding protein [Desulfobacterales bacterium]
MNAIERVEKNAALYPDKIALCDMSTEFTFSQVLEKSRQAAAVFQDLGISKGDAVAIMGQNSFDFVFSYFGVLLAGGVVVPVNHKLTSPEVTYILEDSRARLFLFDGSLAAVAGEIDPSIKKMSLDSPAEGFPFLGACAAAPFEPVELKEDDRAQILYTSGTTGNPKGCIHTHKSVVSAGITGARAVDLNETDRMLIAMPIWHSSPLNNWFMGITHAGGTAVIIREYHPLHFLEAIEKRRCTAYFGAPISYLMPLQMIPNFNEFDLSSMKAWIYGGGPIAPETVKKLTAAYRSDRFFQVYGMTESGPTGAVLRPEDHKEHAGAIGCQALPGAELKVMKDTETQAGPGDTGEIWLRAGSMMKAYLNRPEATKDAFFDGWYRTGDMARIDKDGYLFIVDRIKDMIVTGGENVYSKEVEDRIMEHPDVAEAAVIGVSHPDWGETVHAVIVTAQGKELTQENLTDFLGKRLARFKIPKKIRFVPELPHTPSGKVMKYKLRDSAKMNSRSALQNT